MNSELIQIEKVRLYKFKKTLKAHYLLRPSNEVRFILIRWPDNKPGLTHAIVKKETASNFKYTGLTSRCTVLFYDQEYTCSIVKIGN